MMVFFLWFICISLTVSLNKIIFKDFFCPLNIFMVIWGFVFFNTFFVFSSVVDWNFFLYSILFVILFTIPSLLIRPKKTNIDLIYNIDNLLLYKKGKIITFIKFSIFMRFIQIIYYYLVIRSLGGSIQSLFGDSQWLRFAYLNYSSGISSPIFKIIVNIINYVSEMGVIVSAIYSFKEKSIKYLIVAIILALFSSIFSLSKLAFGIDISFVLSTLSLFTYNNNMSLVNKKKFRKTIIRIVICLSIAIFTLLTIISKQRGYVNKEYGFEGFDNIILFELVAYLVTPYMAFNKIMTWNVDYSYGLRTFYPFFKSFQIQLQNFGAINVGIEDTTVYTMPGIFYVDFGLIGSLIGIFIFSIIVNYAYKFMVQRKTFGSCFLYSSIFVCLTFSFFTWMARITFFWLFPVISSIIFFVIVIRGVKFKKG